VLPYWYDEIAPAILSGKKVMVAAHGNSIRAIIKYLDNVPEKEIVELNIPTGIPLVYELDEQLKPIKHYYLASKEEVDAKIASVKAQGSAKK
jgi:2,3-bisphosphoglycerate-dependent phosphoglycerate mutase